MIAGVYSGKYTVENLPESVYFRIAKELTKGMNKGLKAVGKDADTYDKDFLRSLKHNAHVFSGAKTFNQVREMSDFIADNQGRRVPFKEYEAKARQIFDDFNETYLKTEIFQAENSATMASKWQDIEEDKDVLPFLTYSTVGDERVRESHRPLDGVTRPVNDPFWDTYYPPNGWRCRCDVDQEDEEATPSNLGAVKLPKVPPSMELNVGKKKVLFGPQHPYFIVEDQFKELKDNNFGLPIPKEAAIYSKTFNNVKNINEFNTVIKAKYNIKESSLKNIDLPILKEQFTAFENLFNEYKITDLVAIQSKNLKKLAGPDEMAKVIRVGDDKSAILILNENTFRLSKRGEKIYSKTQDSFKLSRAKNEFVEVINNDLSTITHEFAHLFGNSKQSHNKPFFNELKKVKTRYTKELNKLEKDLFDKKLNFDDYLNKRKEIFISEYSSTNLDEFLAEAFTDYKLGKNKSPYSLNVGKIIDKYFKK